MSSPLLLPCSLPPLLPRHPRQMKGAGWPGPPVLWVPRGHYQGRFPGGPVPGKQAQLKWRSQQPVASASEQLFQVGSVNTASAGSNWAEMEARHWCGKSTKARFLRGTVTSLGIRKGQWGVLHTRGARDFQKEKTVFHPSGRASARGWCYLRRSECCP